MHQDHARHVLYEQYGHVSHTALVLARGHRALTLSATNGGQSNGFSGQGTAQHSGARNSGGEGGLLSSRHRQCRYNRKFSLQRTVCNGWRVVRWGVRSSLRNLIRMDRVKSTTLGALVLQTSVLALTIRYSRTETVRGPRYLTSTAVVMSELVKLLACLYMVFYHSNRCGRRAAWEDLLNVKEAVKTAVPAGIYTLQNNLQFIAVSYLDAATFQVTYQLKILTTALFSVLFLQRQLDSVRWTALVMLTVGVVLVQLPAGSEAVNSPTGGSTVLGLLAVLTMCLSSGFAGVYFEKILKSSTQSLWAKNVQMAFVSVFLGLAAVVMGDWSLVQEQGFFQGYNTLTLVIVLQQAVLGLIISLVMKYADNILKGFASAISIVLTTIVSSILLHDLQPSCSFLSGSIVVMASVLVYNVDRETHQHSLHSVI